MRIDKSKVFLFALHLFGVFILTSCSHGDAPVICFIVSNTSMNKTRFFVAYLTDGRSVNFCTLTKHKPDV